IRGWLGIMIQDITPELAKSFDMKETKGALVADVLSDSPAQKAGLKQGDIVIGMNGKPIDDAHTLSRMVAAISPNTKISLKIIRDGKTKEIDVTIGTMPEEGAETAPAKKESAWGLTVQNLTPELAKQFGWEADERGVMISAVEPDSAAAEARLRAGDLIKEVNRQKIQNLRDYKQAVEKAKKDQSLLLLIKRGENTFYVALKPAQK
ncbi:MAG: PDZ domain-containing protein, partial [Desulfoferrobacter sp.]